MVVVPSADHLAQEDACLMDRALTERMAILGGF